MAAAFALIIPSLTGLMLLPLESTWVTDVIGTAILIVVVGVEKVATETMTGIETADVTETTTDMIAASATVTGVTVVVLLLAAAATLLSIGGRGPTLAAPGAVAPGVGMTIEDVAHGNVLFSLLWSRM
jgi:hypothetical protein